MLESAGSTVVEAAETSLVVERTSHAEATDAASLSSHHTRDLSPESRVRGFQTDLSVALSQLCVGGDLHKSLQDELSLSDGEASEVVERVRSAISDLGANLVDRDGSICGALKDAKALVPLRQEIDRRLDDLEETLRDDQALGRIPESPLLTRSELEYSKEERATFRESRFQDVLRESRADVIISYRIGFNLGPAKMFRAAKELADTTYSKLRAVNTSSLDSDRDGARDQRVKKMIEDSTVMSLVIELSATLMGAREAVEPPSIDRQPIDGR